MELTIAVMLDGQVVRNHVQQVGGTLGQMEETIDDMAREAACGAQLAAATLPSTQVALGCNFAANLDREQRELSVARRPAHPRPRPGSGSLRVS